MTCPNCGHHIPEQRRFHRRSRPQTLYKRVWNKAKRRGFAFWLFDLLGMERDDEFVDLFPGSGAVGTAWDRWRSPVMGGAS